MAGFFVIALLLCAVTSICLFWHPMIRVGLIYFYGPLHRRSPLACGNRHGRTRPSLARALAVDDGNNYRADDLCACRTGRRLRAHRKLSLNLSRTDGTPTSATRPRVGGDPVWISAYAGMSGGEITPPRSAALPRASHLYRASGRGCRETQMTHRTEPRRPIASLAPCAP
jgi:hypothetical protein